MSALKPRLLNNGSLGSSTVLAATFRRASGDPPIPDIAGRRIVTREAESGSHNGDYGNVVLWALLQHDRKSRAPWMTKEPSRTLQRRLDP